MGQALKGWVCTLLCWAAASTERVKGQNIWEKKNMGELFFGTKIKSMEGSKNFKLS